MGSTPAVWEMTGKSQPASWKGAAGPSSDFQPTPVSWLRKQSKGQDRVEPARPTREHSDVLLVPDGELRTVCRKHNPRGDRAGRKACGRAAGALRLRIPREPHKERVIAFRLRVGIRCGLAHSADEYTDDQQDEKAER